LAADYPKPVEVELQRGVAVVVKLLSSVCLDDNLDGIDELALEWEKLSERKVYFQKNGKFPRPSIPAQYEPDISG
jgi:hypothetical protein